VDYSAGKLMKVGPEPRYEGRRLPGCRRLCWRRYSDVRDSMSVLEALALLCLGPDPCRQESAGTDVFRSRAYVVRR